MNAPSGLEAAIAHGGPARKGERSVTPLPGCPPPGGSIGLWPVKRLRIKSTHPSGTTRCSFPIAVACSLRVLLSIPHPPHDPEVQDD
jgi:hypothetical protein